MAGRLCLLLAFVLLAPVTADAFGEVFTARRTGSEYCDHYWVAPVRETVYVRFDSATRITLSESRDFSEPMVMKASTFRVAPDRSVFMAEGIRGFDGGTAVMYGTVQYRMFDNTVKEADATYLGWWSDGCFGPGKIETKRRLR